ncbi:E3 ubiquitin-protein ligase ATL23 [Mercurialis annua]|uniref:E3 ubiquitin-protein ligase ATL23 n=1 Tax=Mercurialis annua TaxID=3986 RepID=UPI0021600568|nr:E3 ubiquitin-protein ligase ATL23 [Mercurialis annua]
MRYGVHYAPSALLRPLPPILLSPSPSPTAVNLPYTPPPQSIASQNMLLSVFLALFLPCVGMSAVFLIYICLLWYAASHNAEPVTPVKPGEKKGLSPSDLDKLPKMTGKELVLGNECAVCLDEIENEQPARLVPGCNHGFHLECADTWLSKHNVCPVCRSKLDAQFFNASKENPC